MQFTVGDTLSIRNQVYNVTGLIRYRNIHDGCTWFEYKLKSKQTGKIVWLSYDEHYSEYSLSEVNKNASISGFHTVDTGVEEVIDARGNVDVDIGERANFTEYEDASEEYIVSSEVWSDGEEKSTGYYIEKNEIQKLNSSAGSNSAYSVRYESRKKTATPMFIMGFIFFGFIFSSFIASVFSSIITTTTIAKYLEKSPSYTYTTSITGTDGEKADVYSTSYTVDEAVKDIISGIDGKTEDVQQNTEDGDNSVAILTNKEYCLVYTSEDNETLVQISTRKFAYENDHTPYHGNSYVRRYYRRYYYSRGYTNDSTRYDTTKSSYNSYDDTTLSSDYDNTYNTYSSSVRQASVTARTSSGGGTSSGK